MRYNDVADSTGLIRSAVVVSLICEIPLNFLKIRTYSSLRSSKVIDLGVNRKLICNFVLVITSNFDRTANQCK